MRYTLMLLFISWQTSSVGQINSQKEYELFRIERSRDANTIFYEVRLNENGKLNMSNPIKIYWIKYTDKGQKEPLTWIQTKFAYGIKYLETDHEMAKFQFVSYRKRDFILKKDKAGQFKVYTQLNGKLVVVNKIFIQIDGGSFWFPEIPKVELYALDYLADKEFIETIRP